MFWIGVKPKTEHDEHMKRASMNLLLAFPVSLKRYLRSESGTKYDDLHHLIVNIPGIHNVNVHVPMEISYNISSYISHVRAADMCDVPTTAAMIANLSGMVDWLSVCERIRTTPIPKAYSIHLRQTLFLYLATLPFQLLTQMGYGTIPIVFVSSFTLLGILAIGGEIENPFGYDKNDLKLDDFCEGLRLEMMQLIQREPGLNWLPHQRDGTAIN
jgi:putative membrane protein